MGKEKIKINLKVRLTSLKKRYEEISYIVHNQENTNYKNYEKNQINNFAIMQDLKSRIDELETTLKMFK